MTISVRQPQPPCPFRSISFLTKKDNTFSGAMVAWQQIFANEPESQVFFEEFNRIDFASVDVLRPHISKSANNFFAFATSGFTTENDILSFGLSAMVAKLKRCRGASTIPIC